MSLYSMAVRLFLMTSLLISPAYADSEEAQITKALNLYIEGTSYSHPEQIAQAFYSKANLLLTKEEQAVWSVPVDKYIDWYRKRPEGTPTGRQGEIISIDVNGDIATAKVEIVMPNKKDYYLDLFLLRKIDNAWKIISKTASKAADTRTGNKILFIVSSAHFHGDSDLPTGVSYSEIVKAYHTFTQAGYYVDFVSPEGGAIPLSYVNTADELTKQYLYDSDLMYAIAHTKSPEQIKPEQYKAVHYVGGGNAMYGVAQDKGIQAITMEIYEEHNGIISSVCHGTAGIAFLKLKSGEFLVHDKRISGYPDVYENTSKAYFKEFPFHITKTIEAHGGTFLYSPRNSPHVEVDGRIVTGQNHLSSTGVAEKIIELIESGSAG